MEPYPVTWPRPNPDRPESLQSRITEAQKLALYNRQVTTRQLAKDLGVHERYISYMFPYKVPIYDKRPLMEVRKAFKLEVAVRVLKGEFKTSDAAKVAHVSYNTMHRFVAKAKAKYPELAAIYEAKKHAR